jgi:hypothetical protein
VAAVYVDVDRALWPFAEWSVRAQLVYLAERGGLPPGMDIPAELPGPLPQPLGVEHQDRLGLQLDPAARDEVGERLVDRLP